MTAHAKLSASSAARWMACPPSVSMSEGYADTASKYAAEGTLAHALAELILTKHFTKGIGPVRYAKMHDELISQHKWEGEALYAPEMDKYVEVYTDYVKQVAMSYPSKPFVYLERRVDFSEWVPGGFGTADCLIIYDNELRVMDLKYGKGVPVSAENNPQLMLYALGAYAAFKLLCRIEKVTLTIVQPRLDGISEWSLSIGDLLAFGEKVKPLAEMADKGEGEFHPGDHCRFCKARNACKARADHSIRLAHLTKQQANTLSNDEIGHYLEVGKDVASWLADLQEYALSQCLAGNEVAGWKAVEGTSRRTWRDGEAAFAAIIKSGVDEALLYERKPLTLAQVEKLVGKKDFEQFSQFVYKPPGKPTLVQASDKRDAISNVVKAKDVFKEVNG